MARSDVAAPDRRVDAVSGIVVLVVLVVLVSAGIAAVAVVAAVRASRAARRVEREVAALADELPGSAAPATGDDAATRAADIVRARVAASERELARVVAAVRRQPDGVVVVDEHGEVVLRNDAAERYDGARHADAIAEQAIAEMLDAAREGRGSEREIPLFGPPRTVLHLRAAPLRTGGELLGAVVAVRDVTEARRTEAIRREFVANVSHELKTPIGALALLAETMATGTDPVVMAQLADRLVREADRLARIVDDLLDLSLIEAQEAPTREPVPVHVLLGDALELVDSVARSSGVPVEVAPVSTDLEVTCDRRQLVSAIRNLLDNAVKYSEPGDVVELSAVSQDGRVRITVRDHGVGIPARDLERIFERFYRVDRARSRDTGGTGLGLAIVRHIVQAHGGEVSVDSVEGEGSVFTLVVPVGAVAGRTSWSEAS